MFNALLWVCVLGFSTVCQDDAEVSQEPKSIQANGLLQARDAVELRNTTGAEAVIIDLVAEGIVVRKGDLVAQLDDSKLQEQLEQQKIIMLNAGAEIAVAENSIATLQSNLVESTKWAKQQITVAELNQKRILDDNGKLDLDVQANTDQIGIEKQRLDQYRQRLHSLESSQVKDDRQIQSMQLDIAAARSNISSLENKNNFLNTFERSYQTARLAIEIQSARLALARLKRVFESRNAKVAAQLGGLRKNIAFERERLEQISQQIDACKIYAPRDGIVHYGSPALSPTDYQFEIEPGTTVRDRQTIAFIPDMRQLQFKVLIDESDIDRVRVGQQASIRFRGISAGVFVGKVFHVNRYRERNCSDADERQYAILVSLSDLPERVSLGSQARVVLPTAEIDD